MRPYPISCGLGFLHVFLLDHVDLLGQPFWRIHKHRGFAAEEIMRHRSLFKSELTRYERLAVMHDGGQGRARVKPTLYKFKFVIDI